MHWHPEHASSLGQRTLEQHLDVSSTTISPVHKSDIYLSGSQSCYNYPWANDDISALTASNLLRCYADKYSGMLDPPHQEQGTLGVLDVQKTEVHSWPMLPSTDAAYALMPPEGYHTKAGAASGSSLSVVSNHSDSGFSSSSSNEYQGSYNSPYLAPEYSELSQPLVPRFSPTKLLYNYPGRTCPQISLSHTSSEYPPGGQVPPISYNAESQSSLKRMALDGGLEDEVGSYNKKCINNANKYPNYAESIDATNECGRNRFGKEPQNFKSLMSPQREGVGKVAPFSDMMVIKSDPEHTSAQQHQSLSGSTVELQRNPGSSILDANVRDLLDLTPAVPWSDLVGLAKIKAVLEEEVLWPTLKPGVMLLPPKTILLFGPRGGGKTTLTRSLAAQLGASFYLVNAALLVSKGKAQVKQVLDSLLQVSMGWQPSVVLLNQVEVLQEGLGLSLLSSLEKAKLSTGMLVFVCATSRPDLLQDFVHRSFSKRYHIDLHDGVHQRAVDQRTSVSQ